METVEKSAKPTATTDLAFNATVGVYTSHKEALHAVHKLLENGYSKESISIVGKNNFVEEVKGTYNWGDAAEEGMKVGGVAGGVLGALAGLGLIGRGAGLIPASRSDARFSRRRRLASSRFAWASGLSGAGAGLGFGLFLTPHAISYPHIITYILLFVKYT